ELVAFEADAQRLQSPQGERSREIISAIERPDVLDQATVRMVGGRSGSVYIFIGQIVRAVAGLARSGRHLVKAEQVGDLRPVTAGRELEEFVSASVEGQRRSVVV